MSPSLLKPRPLPPGGTIGVTSPSAYFAGREAQWERMQRYFTSRGYRVKEAPSARHGVGYLAGTDTERLAGLHTLFEDPEVDAVFCSQGGYGVMRILDQIDYGLIASHPKILMGYSDASALILAVSGQTGLVTFHGPMAVSDFGRAPANVYTEAHCWEMLTGEAMKTVPFTLGNALAKDYQMLQPGTAMGKLVVCNLQLLCSLLGTPYFPDLTGAILVVEDVGGYIYILDRLLTSLRLAGVLDRLAGLLFGSFPYMFTENPLIPINTQGAPTVAELLGELTRTLRIPVGYGFSSGHLDEKNTLPLGVQASFCGESGQVALLEPWLMPSA